MMCVDVADDSFITETYKIKGMTCVNCQNKIGAALQAITGVYEVRVSYNRGRAVVEYDPAVVTPAVIAAVVEDAGYAVIDADEKAASGAPDIVGLLLVIAALFLLIQHFGLTRFFTSVPLVSAGMSYGALFVIGLVTSLHCIAMCGGINLSQTITPTGTTDTPSTVTTDTPPTVILSEVSAANVVEGPQSSKHLGPSTTSASADYAQDDNGGVTSVQRDGGGNRFAQLRPSLLYNLGRVISYTAVGAVVGALGKVISFSGGAKGIVQIVAGVFMLIMGLNMLGVAPFLRRLTPRMPAFIGRLVTSKRHSNSPLYVGLLNGLMPCGPLQAMQIYALSTGSPVKGALSMLVFSLGTVPLMFGLGALSSYLSKKFTQVVLQIGAVLVVVLGLVMLTTGLSLSGVRLPAAVGGGSAGVGTQAVIEGDVQTVTTTLASGTYEPITVRVGVPVKWTINARDEDINGCNGSIVIPAYGIEYDFKPGANVIEFTPTVPGTFGYTCWMGMISSTITVLDENGQLPQSGESLDEVQGLARTQERGTNDGNDTNPTLGAEAAAGGGCACCSGAAAE